MIDHHVVVPPLDMGNDTWVEIIEPTPEQAIRERWAGTGQSEKAVQVARCESRFDPNARNGVHIGVFQINWRLHAPEHGPAWLFDLFNNIETAYDLWDEQGWVPWSCA